MKTGLRDQPMWVEKGQPDLLLMSPNPKVCNSMTEGAAIWYLAVTKELAVLTCSYKQLTCTILRELLRNLAELLCDFSL